MKWSFITIKEKADTLRWKAQKQAEQITFLQKKVDVFAGAATKAKESADRLFKSHAAELDVLRARVSDLEKKIEDLHQS